MKTKPLGASRVAWFLGVTALVLGAPPVHAQEIPSHGQPTGQHCRVLANQLRSNPHSEAFRRALGSDIAACGSVGAEAIASAIRSAKAIQESGFAEQFLFAVSYNQNPAILETLVQIAGDPTATTEMRIVAIEGALRQIEIESAFSRDVDELAARPVGDDCDIVYVEDGGDYKSRSLLPADAKAATAASLRRIAGDSGNPQVVRDAARCVAAHLDK